METRRVSLVKERAIHKKIVEYFNLDNEQALKRDFNFRKELLKSILESLGINLKDRPLIYVEPDNFSDLDVFKEVPSFYKALVEDIENVFEEIHTRAFTTLNIKDTAQKIKDKLRARGKDYTIPKILEEKNPLVIGLNTKSFFLRKHPMYPLIKDKINPAFPRSMMWSFVHEVMHNFLNEEDEQIVQRQTFEYLLKYNYLDEIGVAMIDMLVDTSRVTGNTNEYDIFDYMVHRVKQKDPVLLGNYIIAFYDIIEHKDVKKEINPRLLIHIRKWLADMFNQVEYAEDFVEYEDYDYNELFEKARKLNKKYFK